MAYPFKVELKVGMGRQKRNSDIYNIIEFQAAAGDEDLIFSVEALSKKGDNSPKQIWIYMKAFSVF